MTHSGQTGFYVDTDGVRLLGTIFLAKGDDPKPTALILHGIPGIEKNFDLAHAFRRRGWNAVIFHYRGCWGSSGAYEVTTIPRDVRAIVDWLCSGAIHQVDAEKLIVIGHSLGGWAAVLSAAADPRLKAVAALGTVGVISAFRLSEPEYAADYTPWLSGITPAELARQWASIGEMFSPTQRAPEIAPRPFLIVHGSQDETLSIKHARELWESAGRAPVLVEIPEANHSFTWHREQLINIIFNWLPALNRNTPSHPSRLSCRPLEPGERNAAAHLLSANGLPLDGFPADCAVILGLFVEDVLRGCAALEIYETNALLRSVAVDPALHGKALGTQLTHTALIHAAAHGVQRVYLLTETAEAFFPRFGFIKIPRIDAPENVKQSIEFTSACPDSAAVMTRRIDQIGE